MLNESNLSGARYIVGIDLGTTNCAVMFVDTLKPQTEIVPFQLPQYVSPGVWDNRLTLPSFHYELTDPEGAAFRESTRKARAVNPNVPDQSRKKAAGEYIVGVYARDFGQSNPGRLVSSAKSWLCHTQVDRTGAFLPWKAPEETHKISPVEASSRYLKYIADCWNAAQPDWPLEQQDIVVTLPASFDETARELTIKAAKKAGLTRIALIEEPQAAFYAWIYKRQEEAREAGKKGKSRKKADAKPKQTWNEIVKPGDKILVCDIGGGTSDFTIIQAKLATNAPGPNDPSTEKQTAIPQNSQQTSTEPSREIAFHRTAVGDHLILGGDNLDLTLAKYLEGKFTETGQTLSPRQWQILVRQSRSAKETLLGYNPPESYSVSIPGSGSKLIAASLTLNVTRDEVQKLLLDGFFPVVPLSSTVQRRTSGFQEFGLPFAPDPAVTRYLATFLSAHRFTVAPEASSPQPSSSQPSSPQPSSPQPSSPQPSSPQPSSPQPDSQNCESGRSEFPPSDPARPDIVLFNGGMFESPLVRERLINQLSSWFSQPPNLISSALPETGSVSPQTNVWRPIVLENDALDLAVARGAAYFGRIRRSDLPVGEGESELVKIQAALARTYYVGIDEDGTRRALCIAPASAQTGETVRLNQEFRLTIGTPVEFPLYVSSSRLTDKIGDILDIDETQMRPLAPLNTVIRSKRKDPTVEVGIQVELSEIGTLEMSLVCLKGRGSWLLNFDVRASTQTDAVVEKTAGESQGTVDKEIVQAALSVLKQGFGPQPVLKSADIPRKLSEAIQQSRDSWPTTLLRALWQGLMDWQDGRKTNAAAEGRWLNLLGFALRPGFGAAMDDWRIEQTWKAIQGNLCFPQESSRLQLWIVRRRIAGGLNAGRQLQMAEPVLKALRTLTYQVARGKKKPDWPFSDAESAEIFRFLGAMENLPADKKEEAGTALLDLLERDAYKAWRNPILDAIGRLGARQGFYGTLDSTVPALVAETWIKKLIKQAPDRPTALAVMLLARKTSDRYRDIAEGVRGSVVSWMRRASEQSAAPTHYLDLVLQGGVLDCEETTQILGDSLPIGLKIC